MNETRKQFKPPPQLTAAANHKKPPIGIFAFSTSNYDEMKKFFSDLGFNVREDPQDQLVPLFNQGRACYISWGDVSFNLEESTSSAAKASFNLWVLGCSREQVERVKTLGYSMTDSGPTLFGREYSFVIPDGGTIVIHDEGEGIRARLLTMFAGGHGDP
jgi:hypothetical protein